MASDVEKYDKVFEEAKNGGKHGGEYKSLLKQADNQLLRSIDSYKKRIKEHTNKINNPENYVNDWVNHSEYYKTGAIKRWEKEITQFNEKIIIAEMIAQERKLL